ncbi:hypothetical protein GYV61_07105 [Lactobacillus melliventris]|uniref:restriction endonuclease subunit S n=1 Tax=Lactobacillus melliventris TaxID=1218507 RepID=UPI00157FC524|nr:restriction endonuclease subunit S [Lactobacillus melliventris]NUE98512.1 hypothetical protein [Lactobacillus melliventris]
MKKHNSVPNMRFSGFEDEWKDKKLGKITKYVKGFAFESKLYTEDGIRIIKVTDLTNKKIKNENGSSTYISETMATKFKKYIIHQKDIIITTVGSKTKLKSSSVGRAIYIDMSKNYLLNQNLVKLTALSGFDSFFIYSQLEQPKYINYISKIERGNANQANIEIKDLWNYIVKASSIKEQQKIGNFFAKLDKLLDLQQQKIDKLELLKKALLQKLFPKHDAKIPELRFKGFEDDWTDRKFVNCLTKIIDFRGKTPKKLGLSWSNNGKYRALSAINVKNGFIDKNIDVHFGNYDLYKKWMGKTELEKGDILFTTEAPMGNIAIINDNEKYILSQRTIAFRVDEKNINSRFLLYRLNTVSAKNKLMSLSTGGTAQGISQKNLSYLFISISNSIYEQKRIGNILAKVDHLIYLENKKLQNFQQVKKCLLQNMFVE